MFVCCCTMYINIDIWYLGEFFDSLSSSKKCKGSLIVKEILPYLLILLLLK